MATTVLTAGILSRGQRDLFIPRLTAAWPPPPLSGDTAPGSPGLFPVLRGSAASPPPPVALRPALSRPPWHPTCRRPAGLPHVRRAPPRPSWLRHGHRPRARARNTRRLPTTGPQPGSSRCRRPLAAPPYDRRLRPWHLRYLGPPTRDARLRSARSWPSF